MKNRTLIFLVLLLVAVIAADAAVIKVKVATANVRTKPDLTAPVISRASQGALFEVQKKTGNWYEIQAVDNAGNIVTGYISADVVDEVGGGAAPAQPTRPAATAQPVASQEPASGYAAPKAAGGFFVLGGPVLSNIAFSEDLGEGTTKSPRFGFAAGIGYELPFTEMFSLVPSVLFTTGGTVLKAGEDSFKYVANALAVPVLFKINFGGGPYVIAGPYFSLVMGPKITYDIGGETGEEDIETANMNTFQMGIVVGAGFEIPMGANTFAIQAAYSLGFTKLNKEGEGTAKPNAINIFAIFKF
jgi:hypothetical protein